MRVGGLHPFATLMEDQQGGGKRARGEGGGGGGGAWSGSGAPSPISATPAAAAAAPPTPPHFAPLLPTERAEHALLSRPSPFPNESGSLACVEFAPGEASAAALASARVLVIGAGGLGCDVLKNLALSGVRDIHVVDMDTIDLSNLNRQFLFRLKDVGRHKADVAAEFVRARVPGVAITAHREAIQRKPLDFYRGFSVVIGALDNLDARRWMSRQLVKFAGEGVPYVDGGSERLGGTVRVIIPTATPCFECIIDTFPPQQTFQVCTLTDKPRRPEHCVGWALMVAWPAAFPARACDRDSKADMEWLVARAQERAGEFGIEGVTFAFALGVAKNIIPAIAATNGLTAAACALEALKLLTGVARTMDNTLECFADAGQNFNVARNQKRDDCPACGPGVPVYRVACGPRATLGELVAKLKEEPKIQVGREACVVVKGARVLFKGLGKAPEGGAEGLGRYRELLAAQEASMEKTMGELLGTDGASSPPPTPPPPPRQQATAP